MHRCSVFSIRAYLLLAALSLILGSALSVPSFAADPTPTAVEEYHARPDRYSILVEEAVDALTKRDGDRFRKLLSPSLIKRTEAAMGKGAIDTIIEERFIPFFSDFVALNDSVETIPTSDPDGHKGLALFYSFRTEDGDQRPFAIYLLNEDDKLVVGNLLLNKLLYDVVGADRTAGAGKSK